MYRSRSELMPVFDLKFSNHANDIITSVSYSDEHLVFFDSFTKQKRKESFSAIFERCSHHCVSVTKLCWNILSFTIVIQANNNYVFV